MFITPDKISELGDSRCLGSVERYVSPHTEETNSEPVQALVLKEAFARFGKDVRIVYLGGSFCQAVYAVF